MRCDPSFGKYKGTLGVIIWVWLVFAAQNSGFTFQEKENECWQTAYTEQKDVWSAQNEWAQPTWNQQIFLTVFVSSRLKAQLKGREKNEKALKILWNAGKLYFCVSFTTNGLQWALLRKTHH